MPIVTCPNCRKRYDPGIDDDLTDMPGDRSIKVVCPACGQWLRLPENELIDPPDVPADILKQMMGQSRLVEDEGEPAARREPEEDRPRRRQWEDDEPGDRPRRRSRPDYDDDDYYRDRPVRTRRHRYGDERDDFDDDYRGRPPDGLGVTSMVIGIISCVASLGTCLCIIFTGFGVIGGVIAMVLGFAARAQNPLSKTARTGIWTGIIAIVLGILLVIVNIVIFIGMGALK